MKRREKIIAVAIIVSTAIASIYLLLSAYLEALYIREKIENPGLRARSSSYAIRDRFIWFSGSKFFNVTVRDALDLSLNDLIIYYNGTLNESADEQLLMLRGYRISGVKEIIERINSFMEQIGLKTDYFIVAISYIDEIYYRTPKSVKTLDYIIHCKIIYLNFTKPDDILRAPKTIFYLSISAYTGAITGFDIRYSIPWRLYVIYDVEKTAVLYNLSLKSCLGDRNAILKLLEFLGFDDENYKLYRLEFKVKESITYTRTYNHISRIMHFSRSYRVFVKNIPIQHLFLNLIVGHEIIDEEEIYDITFKTNIFILRVFNIQYRKPLIHEDDAKNIARGFIRDKLDIPEKIIYIGSCSQIFYFKDEDTMTNYYVVKAVLLSKKHYNITLYIDPVNGEIHDYAIINRPYTQW